MNGWKKIKEISTSMGYLSNLMKLHMCSHWNLKILSNTIGNLNCLEYLDLKNSKSLRRLWILIGDLIILQEIVMDRCIKEKNTFNICEQFI